PGALLAAAAPVQGVGEGGNRQPDLARGGDTAPFGVTRAPRLWTPLQASHHREEHEEGEDGDQRPGRHAVGGAGQRVFRLGAMATGRESGSGSCQRIADVRHGGASSAKGRSVPKRPVPKRGAPERFAPASGTSGRHRRSNQPSAGRARKVWSEATSSKS